MPSLTPLTFTFSTSTPPHPLHLTYSLSFTSSVSLHPLHALPLPGIVRSHTECVELVSQKLGGKVLFKRELTVYDQSNTEVRLTLWGDKGNSSYLLLSLSDSSIHLFSSSLPFILSSSLCLFFSYSLLQSFEIYIFSFLLLPHYAILSLATVLFSLFCSPLNQYSTTIYLSPFLFLYALYLTMPLNLRCQPSSLHVTHTTIALIHTQL